MAQQGQPGTTGAGTDPAYVPDRDVFDSYTHQQIWDLAHAALTPAELSRLADTWGRTATAVETAFDEFARDIARFSGDWSGLSAAAAAQAAAAFVCSGDDAVAVCHIVEQLLSADSTAAESVRAAIPPPPGPYLPDPDPAVEAVTGAQRRTAYNTAAAALTAAAQDAMTFGYNPTIAASGDNVPRFAVPADEDRPGDPPTAGAPASTTEPSATTPPTSPDRARTPAGRESRSSPPAAPPPGPGEETNESGSAPSGSGIGPGAGRPGVAPGEESAESSTAAPRPYSGAPVAAPSPDRVDDRSDADGPALGSDVTVAPAPAAGQPAGENSATESAGATGPQPAPPTTSAGVSAVADHPDATITRTAVPHQAPPGAWGPTGTGGGTGGPPEPAASPTGNRPGPINSSAPAATQAHSYAPGSESGIAQRPGHTEQIARPALPRAATESARESLGTASSGPDTAAAGERSEHSGARTARPTGPPLPTATRAAPPRESDRDRTGPDYLRAPNEQLTATSPTTPPVFGEYTEDEKPDRTEPGGGSR